MSADRMGQATESELVRVLLTIEWIPFSANESGGTHFCPSCRWTGPARTRRKNRHYVDCDLNSALKKAELSEGDPR